MECFSSLVRWQLGSFLSQCEIVRCRHYWEHILQLHFQYCSGMAFCSQNAPAVPFAAQEEGRSLCHQRCHGSKEVGAEKYPSTQQPFLLHLPLLGCLRSLQKSAGSTGDVSSKKWAALVFMLLGNGGQKAHFHLLGWLLCSSSFFDAQTARKKEREPAVGIIRKRNDYLMNR